MTSQNAPVLSNSKERIESITNNTNAIFNIDNNTRADSSYGEWRTIRNIGIEAINAYSSIIDNVASQKGVDPNLVKSIIYIEHAQGYHDEVAETLLGWTGHFSQKTIKPMNINHETWLGLAESLGYSQQDFNNPQKNIEIGVELIKRIEDRLAPEDRTPDKIYSIYNFAGNEKVSDIGARLENIYNQKEWTKAYELNNSWSNFSDQYEEVVDGWIEEGLYKQSQKQELMKQGEVAFKSFFKKSFGVDDVETSKDSKGNVVNKVKEADLSGLSNEQKQNLAKSLSEKSGSSSTKIVFEGTQTSYTIKSGDTLSEIAKNNNTTVEKLLELNPQISNPDLINSGSTINIPTQKEKATATFKKGNTESQLTNSGIIKPDSSFNNGTNNNQISRNEVFIKIEDKDGNIFTLIRDDVFVPLVDGTQMALNKVIETVERNAKYVTDFIQNQAKDYGLSYKDYLIDNKQIILGDLAAALALGQPLDKAFIATAEKWGVNAIFNNKYISDSFFELFGITDFAKGNGFENGYLTYAKDAQGNILSGADGKPLYKLTAEGQGAITNAEIVNGAKAGAIYFLTTVLLGELNGGMNGEEYTEAAIKAATIAALEICFPDINVTVVLAVVDGLITAITDYDDLNAQGWQDLATSVAAAVASAVAAMAIGAEIGTAIMPVVGTIVGAIVGAVLYVPLNNLLHDNIEALEEINDAIHDIFWDLDFSINNIEENIKQAIKAVEDILKASTIDLGLDVWEGIGRLAGLYWGKEYKEGEYPDPFNFLNIVPKADGSGNMIFGVDREGVVAIARDGFDDDLYGTLSSDTLIGKSGKNMILGYDGNDYIEGKSNDDTIIGGLGSDLIFGGSGNDKLYGSEGNDTIDGGDGDDVIVAGSGDDSVYGGAGKDQIELGDGNNYVEAGVGNDTVLGGKDDDVIFGEDGDDSLLGEAGEDIIFGGKGNDKIDGGAGADLLYGEEGSDAISGGAGDDTIFGGAGIDIINGEAGNDLINAGKDDDLVLGGIGDDVIYGGSGDDELYGEIGSDLIFGGKGNDILGGGDGNDTYIFSKGDGEDVIDDADEAGIDVIKLANINSDEVENVRENDDLIIRFKNNSTDKITIKNYFIDNDDDENTKKIDRIEFADNTVLKYETALKDAEEEFVSPESLFGEKYRENADSEKYNEAIWYSYKKKRSSFGGHYTVWAKYYEQNLNGDAGSNRIVGSWWNENIYGRDGDDQLIGNDGNDNIDGGVGDDIIFGGAGADNLQGQTGDDAIYGGEDNDNINGGAGDDILYGEAGSDLINGDVGDDLISGGAGNDIINAGAGNDFIFAGLDNDIVNGSAGDDIIFGENGNDLIDGGDGDDKIDAGNGDDVIFDSKGNDKIRLGSGRDIFIAITANGGTRTIKDFNSSEDKIILRDVEQNFAKLISSGKIIQDGANVKFDFGNYKLIIENISLADLSDKNFVSAIVGDQYGNQLNGTKFADAIFGLGGDDTINGFGGDDLLWAGDLSLNNANEVADKDNLNGGNGNDILNGNVGDDTLSGEFGDDIIFGGDGNDAINGGAGSDILRGDKGNDTIYGGETGGDTYIFNKGDGQDVIYDSDKNGNDDASNGDRIILGAGLSVNDVLLIKSGNDLKIEFRNSTDSILIKNQFLNLNNSVKSQRIESIQFSDNADVLDLTSLKFDLGGDGVSVWRGVDGVNNKIIGVGDVDILIGGNRDDILIGNKDNDTLYGGAAGNDSYIFNLGDGKDIIYDADKNGVDYGSSADKIIFGDGINLDDVIFKKSGNDLLISFLNNSADSITIKNQFEFVETSRKKEVEYLQFSDESIFDLRKLKFDGANLVWNKINGEQNIVGTAGVETLKGSSGDDIFQGKAGDDFIYGGAGGNDTYIFNKGDGNDDIRDFEKVITDSGGSNNDKIILGKGITINDVILRKYNSDLVIEFKNSSTDSIQIINNFYNENTIFTPFGRVEYLEFSENNQLLDLKNLDFSGGNADISVWKASAGGTVLNGVADVDYLYGNIGNDTLTGNAGDDKLYGGDGGADSYIYNRGDGKDQIYEASNENLTRDDGSNNDKIILGKGISFEQLGFKKDGNDLQISLLNSPTDLITIKNQFLTGTSKNRVEYLEFSDDKSTFDLTKLVFEGTSLLANIADSKGVINGSAGVDILVGTNAADIFASKAGNDTIYGGAGGNDTYLFNQGDGQDIIYEGSKVGNIDDGATNDVIMMGKGITADDLIIYGSNGQLYIAFKNNTADKITVANQFSYTDKSHRVEYIKFADNDDVIDLTKIYYLDVHAVAGWNGDRQNNKLIGTSRNDTFKADDGDDIIYGNSGNDTIYGGAGKDKIYGGADNDVLYGEIGDDELYGEGGTDNLYGGVGDDILAGGKGTDYLYGGESGNDTYVYNQGDGEDVFNDASVSGALGDSSLNDKIIFGNGISLENLIFARVGNRSEHLQITFKDNPTDKITINFQFTYDANSESKKYHRIESLQFADNSTFDLTKLKFLGAKPIINGTSGNDNIAGTFSNDAIYGGAGNDTYIYNIGDGADTYIDESGLSDSIKMASGITADDLSLSGANGNLYINFKNTTTDSITVNGQFSNVNNRIEYIKFADNDDVIDLTILDFSRGWMGDSANNKIVGVSGNDTIFGRAGDDILKGYAGNDTLYGEDGNDSLYGGDGADSLQAGFGDDILDGGKGNDNVRGGAGGNDTYIYNRGDGADTFYDASEDGRQDDGSVNDKIILGAGISVNDITLTRNFSDLVIYFKNNPNDSIRITNQYYHEAKSYNQQYHRIEYLKFTDSNITLDLTKIKFKDSSTHADVIWTGDSSDDVLIGVGDFETLNGGAGNDILIGNGDKDILNGGVGNDIFKFNSLADSSINAMDVIEDFEKGKDKIDFSEINGMSFKDLSFSYQNNQTIVEDNDSDFQIALKGQYNLTEQDFIF